MPAVQSQLSVTPKQTSNCSTDTKNSTTSYHQLFHHQQHDEKEQCYKQILFYRRFVDELWMGLIIHPQVSPLQLHRITTYRIICKSFHWIKISPSMATLVYTAENFGFANVVSCHIILYVIFNTG